MEYAKKLADLAPRIMNAFHDLGQRHHAGEKLSMRQYQALIILHANKALTLSKLCQKLSLAPSTGTELVNRMITLEHIKKEQEKSDQRQVLLSVSDKGLNILKKREQALTEMFSQFLSPFSEQDKKLFVDSFQNIMDLIFKYHS